MQENFMFFTFIAFLLGFFAGIGFVEFIYFLFNPFRNFSKNK